MVKSKRTEMKASEKKKSVHREILPAEKMPHCTENRRKQRATVICVILYQGV